MHGVTFNCFIFNTFPFEVTSHPYLNSFSSVLFSSSADEGLRGWNVLHHSTSATWI